MIYGLRLVSSILFMGGREFVRPSQGNRNKDKELDAPPPANRQNSYGPLPGSNRQL